MTGNAVPVKPVREGFHTVSPYLITSNPEGLIKFIEQAFDGVVTSRAVGSAGGSHVEMRLGDSMIMLGGNDQTPPMPCMIHLYLPDVDATYQRALQAGATSAAEPANFPDGERRGGVQDPFGNQWYISAPQSG
jgi:PhnB protein